MRCPGVRLLIACTALLAVAPSVAGERTIQLVPMIGVRGGATMDPGVPGVPPLQADPAMSFGLGVDVFVRPDGWFEGFVDRQRLRFSAGPAAPSFDVTIDYLQFGGGYQPPEGRVRPFVTAALGLTWYRAGGATVSRAFGLSGSIGGGADVPIGRRVAFRFEARGYATSEDAAFAVSFGPGFTARYTTSAWYQLSARVGLVIRL